MTELIKTSAVREKAKEYALLLRNEKLRTNDAFLNDMDKLVDSVLFLAVKYQDNVSKKTLTSSEWTSKTINKVDGMKLELHNVKKFLKEG
jgi:hypothetical protein